ncbi:type II toxin-antitoxin system RelE family toxin [Acidianus brierleyi]|uniref:type II toxin-antitoxin system RelE family toxin n=1 Tax=Acidianus brierleyi TaxID=41673 RepID=UPI001B31696E|nr:type II toxin-antitoxin system RelE/ParE family toxin [Acidianus brierleyi]
MFSISFIVICKEWKLRIMFSKRINNLDELADYLLDSFASDKLVMLILDKVLLLLDNPFKYSREKLGKDKHGNPMFSIEVTGDIRILYSVDSKNCIVFIWEIGSHKKVYGR